MPPVYRYPLICLLLPVLAVASPNLLRGDGGFEVGGPGLMVRTGLVAGSRRAGLVGEAAEGRTC
ncbi:MAG: hypothetical protein HUU35_19485, partial [Armatimonadetes bacterium]|nr:hypothetical protein [Armatimonadota bacterium]